MRENAALACHKNNSISSVKFLAKEEFMCFYVPKIEQSVAKEKRLVIVQKKFYKTITLSQKV